MNLENNAPVGMPPSQPNPMDQPQFPQPPVQPAMPQPSVQQPAPLLSMMPQQPTMVPQPIQMQSVAPPTKPKGNKRLLIIIVIVVVLIAALAGTGYVVMMRLDNHDITTSVNSTNYAQNTSLDGVSFWMSKQWTVPTPATSDHIDALNYDSTKVTAELQADGHLTDYNNGHASSITSRRVNVYPYSLDELYEIQVFSLDSFSTKQLSRDEVLSANDPSSVKDLQLYHVNGKLVADYIQKGSGGAIDQRIILMRNSTGTKEARIVINRDQDTTLTKDNFDGLMELVGSITFK